ncbi:ADP-ribosylation factor family protein [Actinidia rufa]|uniref:ADP-ribosylation factor family protein n=1 Tax=Actinidia rufa TaxID=165716 RepID=A0A7J0DNS5_9ERIC|nr:ADP-ribosylation factor family protein [Actinidia rufa]
MSSPKTNCQAPPNTDVARVQRNPAKKTSMKKPASSYPGCPLFNCLALDNSQLYLGSDKKFVNFDSAPTLPTKTQPSAVTTTTWPLAWKKKSSSGIKRLSGASLLILANKQDIQGALSPDEIAKVLNLNAMDKTRHWQIMGCSAYTGDGLLEGFDWLVQDIASRIYVLD